MPASVRIASYHGSTPTASTLPAGARFHLGDSDPTTDSATNPIMIPSSGTAYSWRKYLKLEATTAPTGGISNLRFYGSGAWATGCTLYVATNSTYTQPSSSDQSGLMSGAVDLATYTSSSPLTVQSGTVISGGSTGVGTQPYVVLQLAVASNASEGLLPSYTITYRYDET